MGRQRIKVQPTQPIPTHMTLLIAVASTQGHGEEYFSDAP